MDVVKVYYYLDVDEIIFKCNKVIWYIRGVVVVILKIDKKYNEFYYINVGNICFYLYFLEGKLMYFLLI